MLGLLHVAHLLMFSEDQRACDLLHCPFRIRYSFCMFEQRRKSSLCFSQLPYINNSTLLKLITWILFFPLCSIHHDSDRNFSILSKALFIILLIRRFDRRAASISLFSKYLSTKAIPSRISLNRALPLLGVEVLFSICKSEDCSLLFWFGWHGSLFLFAIYNWSARKYNQPLANLVNTFWVMVVSRSPKWFAVTSSMVRHLWCDGYLICTWQLNLRVSYDYVKRFTGFGWDKLQKSASAKFIAFSDSGMSASTLFK